MVLLSPQDYKEKAGGLTSNVKLHFFPEILYNFGVRIGKNINHCTSFTDVSL